MKNCANCGLENPDEALSCRTCSSGSFVSTSPEALGHVISPAEQFFWERMNFRQFAVFLIRLQSVWLLFGGIIDATYILDDWHLHPYFSHYDSWVTIRIAIHVIFAVLCIRFADRLVSWFVKDLVPQTFPISTPPVPPGQQ